MTTSSLVKKFVADLINTVQFGLTDDECVAGIQEICSFFGIPVPKLIDNVTYKSGIGTCVFNRDTTTPEDDLLCYDLRELKSMGVSDIMSYMAVMTHECAHRVFQDYRFTGPDNGQWEKEMVADYFMGVVIGLKGWNVDSIVNALINEPGSGSHPVGRWRVEFVRYGKFEAYRHIIQKRPATTQEYLDLFLEYRKTHDKEITDAELKIY